MLLAIQAALVIQMAMSCYQNFFSVNTNYIR